MTDTNKTPTAREREPLYLASFPELNPNPVFEVDPAGHVIFANPAIQRVLAALGLDSGQVTEFVPADLPDLLARWDKQTLSSYHREVVVAHRTFGETVVLLPQFNIARVYAFDITERKMIEQALGDSNRKLTQVLDSIQDDFYVLDRDWVFVYASRSFTSRVGKEPADFVGNCIWEMFPKHLGTVYEENLRAAMEKREIRRFEVGGKYTDAWYSMACFPSPEGITVLGTDITERKRAEESLRDAMHALQESRTRFQALVETTSDFIWEMDPRGNYTYCSPQLRTLWGFDPQQMVGKSPFDLMPPEDRAQAVPAFSALVASGNAFRNLQVHSFDAAGIDKTLEISGVPFFDAAGELKGYRGITRDITERKQTEQFSNSLSDLYTVIHSTLDLDKIMQQSMQEAARALGCDTAAVSLREEDRWVVRYVHGLPIRVVGSVMSDAEEPHAVLALRTKKPVAVDDAFNDARVDGARMRGWGIRSVLVVPLIVRGHAIGVMFFNYQQARFTFRESHVVFGMQLAASLSLALENAHLFEDLQKELAQRKAAEERILRLNEDLEQRADELQVANEELEQLATSLALDLRAPLVSLRGLSKAIAHDYGKKLPPQARPLFRLIQQNADEMEQLTQGLVKLMRVTRQTLRKQAVSPTEIVRAALADLEPERAGRDVAITLGDLPATRADPLLLKQVWVNLLSNALKATRECEHASIEIGARLTGGRSIYLVRDNGIGFDMEYAGTIFRAFQHYHHPEEWSGSGVGLAIVENIVRRHNGRVWAESAVGQGATFYFEL